MTDPGSAEQPRRPAFGEYATPEEQSRRAGRPLAPPVVHTPPTAPSAVQPVTPAEAAGERPAHPVDRMASIALLAYGLWNVISTVIVYLSPSSLLTTLMQMTGISGTFSNYAQARTWGIVAGVVLIGGWIATAAWSVARLRRGKLTWWLPVAGGVVFGMLAALCLMVPFFSDPAVISYLNAQMQK
ncbi:MAG: hypothetical protein B7X41_17740 [Microbacterium sp. 14-71-5]|uniref:DUF6264 family protein n=1 Tax=Microbacterium sp. 13-71-7 TaxID=1970399 RepID=UPI000BC6BD3C|nr:DUF6264 family protein [Microbacterium sp. 13-71-7]OZB80567.1 MAG: hypothetical protein B7X41_17740 [Microbacterium sp. 14-71-5]OZB82847.1 MAG: hypothetical protein B7X32_12265 [Microbacterium sp. 13-71-7]